MNIGAAGGGRKAFDLLGNGRADICGLYMTQ
jgi:hypothetical protein